ncbi:phosphonate degradation HD-domain oxygenase [Trichothermofontia sp.]
MRDSQALHAIVDLLRHEGHAQYGGEAVTQLEHACQCADLAQKQGASPSLITACLLHDIGHLVHDLGETAAVAGIDDRHECLADHYLRPYFPAAVTEPIRLHVAAKRYLCATDGTYWHQLSANSQHSLQLQGGAFSPQAAATFSAQPYAWEALQLRRWDDQAKVPNLVTPPLATFWQIALTVLGDGGA